MEIAFNHERHDCSDDVEYCLLVCRMHALAVATASSCPWDGALCDLNGWGMHLPMEALHVTLPSGDNLWNSLSALPLLQDWATCLSVAMGHRGRFRDEDLRAFARPVEKILPALPAVLGVAA